MFALRTSEAGGDRASGSGIIPWAVPRRAVLRNMLFACDVVALVASWGFVLGPLGGSHATGTALIGTAGVIGAVTIAFIGSQQLYLARVCRLRSVEVSRLIRVAVVTGLLVALIGPRWGVTLSASLSAAAILTTAVALSAMRGVYNAWLRSCRSDGRHQRPVVIVGPHDEAESIQRHIQSHPEFGLQAVATIGPAGDLMEALETHHSDTVIMAATAFSSVELNRVSRRLLDHGVHVHLSTGLTGIDQRRLRAQPLAREPMFYLEPLRISPWQAAAKRVVDLVGSAAMLLLSLPVLIVAAAAIKLEDRGPVLFRHKRVGRHGDEFTIFKLRTMVRGADRQLHLVAADNQRTGPLYKSHNDPRVTRVGRVLRATSIDELPQLLNVLLGTMSLVGPRPALAHEVAQFDSELRIRERVRPGITGLWQIEGRDDPSFEAYRRLDLFYVENWSLELDLVILLGTARAVVVQAIRDRRRQWRQAPGAGSVIDIVALESAAQ